MAEASHDDIMRRVSAVERTQDAMQSQIAKIGEQSDRAAEAAESNRKAIDARMDEVKQIISAHRDEFSLFRGEVQGAARVVKWGVPVGVTLLLAVVGWALA